MGPDANFGPSPGSAEPGLDAFSGVHDVCGRVS